MASQSMCSENLMYRQRRAHDLIIYLPSDTGMHDEIDPACLVDKPKALDVVQRSCWETYVSCSWCHFSGGPFTALYDRPLMHAMSFKKQKNQEILRGDMEIFSTMIMFNMTYMREY